MKLAWLEDNWIGTTTEYITMEEVSEELLKEGLNSIRVRYLKDKQVLLTGQDGIKMSEIVNRNKVSLKKVF